MSVHCPYCLAPANRELTGNEFPGSEGMCVVEDEDTFDVEIDFFKCSKIEDHVFYCAEPGHDYSVPREYEDSEEDLEAGPAREIGLFNIEHFFKSKEKL